MSVSVDSAFVPLPPLACRQVSVQPLHERSLQNRMVLKITDSLCYDHIRRTPHGLRWTVFRAKLCDLTVEKMEVLTSRSFSEELTSALTNMWPSCTGWTVWTSLIGDELRIEFTE